MTAFGQEATRFLASLESLDEFRGSVLRDFGVGTSYVGGTRMKGWTRTQLLGTTGYLGRQGVPVAISRFLEKIKNDGITV